MSIKLIFFTLVYYIIKVYMVDLNPHISLYPYLFFRLNLVPGSQSGLFWQKGSSRFCAKFAIKRNWRT